MHGTPSTDCPACVATWSPAQSWRPSPAEVQISCRQSHGVCKGPRTGALLPQRVPRFPVAVITGACSTSAIRFTQSSVVASSRVASEATQGRAGLQEIPGERLVLSRVGPLGTLCSGSCLPAPACPGLHASGVRVPFLQRRQRLEPSQVRSAFSLFR